MNYLVNFVDHGSQLSKLVDKSQLEELLLIYFMKLSLKNKKSYLSQLGYSDEYILRYGTLGVYSLYLVSQDLSDLTKLSYSFGSISLNVEKSE